MLNLARIFTESVRHLYYISVKADCENFEIFPEHSNPWFSIRICSLSGVKMRTRIARFYDFIIETDWPTGTAFSKLISNSSFERENVLMARSNQHLSSNKQKSLSSNISRNVL